MRIVLITGMSGAGKSTVLQTLEDLGFEAIDNLPLSLLTMLVRQMHKEEREEESSGRPERLAVSIDVRSREFSPHELLERVDRLRSTSGVKLTLLFLECDSTVIARRYTETRRRHPLAQDRPVADGISQERDLMKIIKPHADVIIDTTDYKGPDLRQRVRSHFTHEGQGLTVCLTSFAYPKGVPRSSDLVFDVRFLTNPHYDPALQPLTGKDKKVGDYVRQDKDYAGFWQHLTALIGPLLPRYAEEGKSYLNLAFGCTGGKHRSVFVTEEMARWLKEQGFQVVIRHRDLPLVEEGKRS